MKDHPTEIGNQAQASISPGTDQPPSGWLRRLDEIEGADLPLVGGKAFRLAQLNQHGFNVPAGLVLTTQFFEAQIRAAKLTPLWAGSPDIAVTAEALQWLADALKTKPLARELAQALNQALPLAFGPDINSFAVRSSVIDEDHRDHTFAGIHLTELGVPRVVVPIAITRCWASALAGPAIQYRQRHGMSIQSIRVAVLIQPMLDPKSSGVGFTINPLNGSRDELIIEAVWGLGRSLVSGDVQPYFYRLSAQPPDYPLLEQRSGNILPPPERAGEAEADPLSARERAELAYQLEQIQALMGEAQDVEWAWQDQRLFILQTRPVVMTPKSQQRLDQEWSQGHYREFLPELPSPFFGSLLERSQNQLLWFFKELGFEINGLGPYEKLILGRPYLNISLFKRMMVQAGLNSAALLQAIGYSSPNQSLPSFSIDWKTAWQARRIHRLAFQQMRQAGRYLEETQSLVEETVALLSSSSPADPAIWLKQLRQQAAMYSELATTQLRLALGIIALTSLGGHFIEPLTPVPLMAVGALAAQGLKFSKDDLNERLYSLSQAAADDPKTKRYLLDAPNDFADYAENPDVPAAFRRDFEQLLAHYGERAAYEADPSWPRYQDDPASLLHIVRQYLKSDHRQTSAEASSNRPPLFQPAQGIDRLLPWRQWLLKPLLKWLRHLLILRDDLNSAKATAMAACRGWALALGQKWVAQGWLEQAEDVFWLTLDEIERMFRIEAGIAPTLSSTIQARKDTYRIYENTNLPQVLRETQLASIQLGVGFSGGLAAEATVGLPISPGQARGTVVVVRHPEEFEKLADDIILVMSSTDPAWLPLLHLACGLIVETGGLLSHGSIIAREYGLPAIANIPQATRRFRTGDKVLVDGSTGVVQLLESSQSHAD